MTLSSFGGQVGDTTQPLRYALNFSTGQRFALTAPTLVGRNPQLVDGEERFNTVVIDDQLRSVSKTHMLLAAGSGGPYVTDRGSTNGTVVTLADGQQILCGPGQKVRIGLASTIIFGRFWVTIELQD